MGVELIELRHVMPLDKERVRRELEAWNKWFEEYLNGKENQDATGKEDQREKRNGSPAEEAGTDSTDGPGIPSQQTEEESRG